MATAHPPHVSHGSHVVTSDEALSLLQRYIADSEMQPWLHPDALLSERGPQSAGVLSGGLTMHNLRRLEAGLRGEWLGADEYFPPGNEFKAVSGEAGVGMPMETVQYDTLASEGGNPLASTVAAAAEYADGAGGVDGFEHENEAAAERAAPNDEWEDLESYQRHQAIDEGELGQRHTGVPNGTVGDIPEVAPSKVDNEVTVETAAGKDEEVLVDKEARKKAKADRKEEKRLKREARAAEKARKKEVA